MWDANSDWYGVDFLHLPYADEASMRQALVAICAWAQKNSYIPVSHEHTGKSFRIRYTNDLLLLPPNRIKQCMISLTPTLSYLLGVRNAASGGPEEVEEGQSIDGFVFRDEAA